MAQKISDYTAKTLDFVDGDLFEVSKFDGVNYSTEKFTWLQLKQGLGVNYKNLVFNFVQATNTTPVFKDVNGNNNPFINTTGATFTWSRVAAGHYALESNISLFDKATFWLGAFHQMQGGTNTWSIPLFGAGGLNGFIYANIQDATTLKIRSVNASGSLTELSTLLGSTDPVSFPEIRIFG